MFRTRFMAEFVSLRLWGLQCGGLAYWWRSPWYWICPLPHRRRQATDPRPLKSMFRTRATASRRCWRIATRPSSCPRPYRHVRRCGVRPIPPGRRVRITGISGRNATQRTSTSPIMRGTNRRIIAVVRPRAGRRTGARSCTGSPMLARSAPNGARLSTRCLDCPAMT